MSRLGWLNLKIGIMRDTCQFWVARTATMKQWSSTKGKGKKPARRALSSSKLFPKPLKRHGILKTKDQVILEPILIRLPGMVNIVHSDYTDC